MRNIRDRVRTNNCRTVKRSMSRFMSLLIMSLLGMLVFVGLASTAPDMISALDMYLDERNVYDIKLVSTLGFDPGDVEKVAAVEGVAAAVGEKSADVIITWGDKEAVMRIAVLPEVINTVKLIEGRMPEKDDEVLVEENFLAAEGLSIGDRFYAEGGRTAEEKLKIVGTVDSPLYYNNVKYDANRGHTNVGSGKVNYYGYILPEGCAFTELTAIYATVDGARGLLTSGSAYKETVGKAISSIEEICSGLEASRYDTVHSQAERLLEDTMALAEEKLSEGLALLESAEAALAEEAAGLEAAKSELDGTEAALETSRSELESTLAYLQRTRSGLDSRKTALDAEKEESDRLMSEFESALSSLGMNREDLMDALVTLKISIETQLTYPGNPEQIAALQERYALLEDVEAKRIAADGAADDYAAHLKSYQDSEAAYEYSYSVYSEKQAAFDEAYAEFELASEEYSTGEAIYARRVRLYESGLKEYEAGKQLADEKIAEAEKAVENIKRPTVYVYGREEYSTYTDYIDDSNSIRNLATLFPAVFFAVAVLVSLISMNKMVEEDRLEIGTMKSLGFPSSKIMSKYLSFSLLATVIGSVIGTALGMILIPALIFHIYSILFVLPALRYTFQLPYIILGFLITVICVCGSSVWTAYKTLRLKPAVLMRPKAPASGHRVFLERIRPLWKRLSFSRKIMTRNLFLYKKRVLLTIGGIACCTALLLTGFGIKDSIVDLPSKQYYGIYQFNAISYVTDLSLPGESGDDGLSLDHFLENDEITYAAAAKRVTADLNDNDGYVLVADPSDMGHIAEFESAETGEPLYLIPGKVIIDEKLAHLEKLSSGDTLHIVDVDNNSFDLEISGVAKNYFEHFAYMSVETYGNAGQDYAPNLVYFQTPSLSASEKQQLSQRLLSSSSVINIAYRDEMIDTVDKSLKSLDSVIFILLVLSAMLAFVVLYNLATINISERKREIATLKVLGFYDEEVDGYISRETIILSIIGIILGLGLGIFLSHAVVATIEVDKARFMNQIKPMSFIYSALMSAAFSLIVTFITHLRLKRIDMIDSLKSVE